MANTFDVNVYIEHGFEDTTAFSSWLGLLIREEMARNGWTGDASVTPYVDTDDLEPAATAPPAPSDGPAEPAGTQTPPDAETPAEDAVGPGQGTADVEATIAEAAAAVPGGVVPGVTTVTGPDGKLYTLVQPTPPVNPNPAA